MKSNLSPAVRRRIPPLACAAALSLALVACDGDTSRDAPRGPEGAGDEHATMQGDGSTNRIDIPPAVRRNLGITFVNVEPRHVEQTLRVPGQFEYMPDARREYRMMVPGRVELLVEQYARVEAGTPICRIDSPSWRELQRAVADAEAAIERNRTRLASFGPLREAHRNHERMLARSIEIRRERVAQLESVVEAGGGRLGDLIDARGAVAIAEAELAEVMEKEAELEADEAAAHADYGAALTRRGLLLDTAASLVSLPIAVLIESADDPEAEADGSAPDRAPRWRTIRSIEIRAEADGIVETLGLTNGAWAEQGSLVVSIVRPERLRFRAVGLQSDLGRLADGLPSRIVAPTPTRRAGAIDLAEAMDATLMIGPAAHPEARTIDLIVVPGHLTSWARAGVAAQLEIVTDPSAALALAVPTAAVQRDGLVSVLFRRDPADANKAIRIEADLGRNDGRWVVVNSGLRRGDEVVLDGAYQLMLATAVTGDRQRGGHFHADGTFHADDH